MTIKNSHITLSIIAAFIFSLSAQAEKIPQSEVLRDVKTFGPKEYEAGKNLYKMVCAACHGNGDGPLPVPNSRSFHKDAMLNGSDTVSLYNTLTKGYNYMPAQTGLTPAQRHYVIHYVREAFFKNKNKSQYVKLTDDYIKSQKTDPLIEWDSKREYNLNQTRKLDQNTVDHGKVIFGNFEASLNNKAPKGLIIGLDGAHVNESSAAAMYDLDTGRLVSFSKGELLNWKDLHYDGSHREHAKLKGEVIFESPAGLAWAKPGKVTPGRYPDFRDPRVKALNGRQYGPLPKNYFTYHGVVMSAEIPSLHYSVGEAEIIETPSTIQLKNKVYIRTLMIKPHKATLYMRTHGKYMVSHLIAPNNVATMLNRGRINEGIVEIFPSKKTTVLHIVVGAHPKSINKKLLPKPAWPELPNEKSADFSNTTAEESAPHFTSKFATSSVSNGFKVEEMDLPQEKANPWNTRIRPAGFDFLTVNKAVMASWTGDIFLLDHLQEPAATTRVTRIASGLHQPLGIKVRNGEIFVGCRDQIMRLHDFDNDSKADYYEAFNTDHILSMHFHEFAAGLDTDKDGNFYYIKCSQHADAAFFERHGTLIKVSPDGKKSEILATGLRSSNGCFVDKDGSIWATDQEGFWNPQNKIMRVDKGKFYGNMLAYHDPNKISPKDEDMTEPMVWLPKNVYNSPSEVFRFPSQGWGGLNNTLGYYEYGKGLIVALAYEEKNGTMQGLANTLPIPQFDTGIMRGRFHPENHSLYACGLFSWGSSRIQRGGLYRVSYTGEGAYGITGYSAQKGKITLTFSDPIDANIIKQAGINLESCTIKRSAKYGSKIEDVIKHPLSSIEYSSDGKSIVLNVPSLKTTRILTINIQLAINGSTEERKLIASIYDLN